VPIDQLIAIAAPPRVPVELRVAPIGHVMHPFVI
jgi:hypothetical protein